MSEEYTHATCSICLNDFGEEEQSHCLDGCNHKFHTKCIVSWFRKASTCPNCRDNTVEELAQIPSFALRERAKELKKISRKKDAPEELKKKVAKLIKIETDIKEKNKKLTEFLKENKEVINTFNKLRRYRWAQQSKKCKMERLIGIFQSPQYPLPSLVIQHYNY